MINLDQLKAKQKEAYIAFWDENASPIMTDREYEDLIDRLEEAGESLYSGEHSRSTPYGDEFDYAHTVPMLSMKKVKTIEQVLAWCARVARSDDELFHITPKFDGIAAKFIRGENRLVTKGQSKVVNSHVGKDVSRMIDMIDIVAAQGWEKAVDDPVGELIVSNAMFESYKDRIPNAHHGAYVSPRTMTAGITNTKDVSDLLTSGIRISLVLYNYTGLVSSTLSHLNEALLSEYLAMLSKVEDGKPVYSYDTDGLVVSIADKAYASQLGSNGKYPRHSVAIKHEDDGVVTEIIDIVVQAGRTKYTPVAIFNPTMVSGVSIKRASLANYKSVLDNDYKVGDKVLLVRSGDTIPHVVRTVSKGEHRKMAPYYTCVSCSTALVYDGLNLVCGFHGCASSNLASIIHTIVTFGIAGIGKDTAERIIDKYNICLMSELLSLSKSELMLVDLIGEGKAGKMIREFQSLQSKGISEDAFIAGIGIHNVNIGTVRKLLQETSLDELLSIPNFTTEQGCEFINRCKSIHGLDERVDEVYTWFSDTGSVAEVHELMTKVKVNPYVKSESVEGEKLIYFTGKFKNHTKATLSTLIDAHNVASSLESAGVADEQPTIYKVQARQNTLTNYLISEQPYSAKVLRIQGEIDEGKHKDLTVVDIEDFLSTLKQ